MKCDTCIYGRRYEYDKPCIVYREDCGLYKGEDMMTREEIIKELSEMRTDAWTDTRQMDALAEGIKALKQEPSGDLISREAVLDELNKWDWQELYLPIHFKENIIDVVPSVNPQEPKTGHWTHDGSHWKYRFLCSECNYKLFEEPSNFCPNCGCRMQESEG